MRYLANIKSLCQIFLNIGLAFLFGLIIITLSQTAIADQASQDQASQDQVSQAQTSSAQTSSAQPSPANIATVQSSKPAVLKLYSYDEALKLAQNQGKFTILFFWTKSCEICRQFKEEVLTNQEVIAQLNADFFMVSIDSQFDKALTRKYRVNAVPRLIFLESTGKPASFLPGGVSSSMFRVFLGYISSESYRSMGFDEFINQFLEDE
ncbi:MAG: thioredoxin fold domain-containing protein [Deltaproteobacteria bacterium]|jgi:thioredoxin-related protein|nr:thioredoxin fold domain-containing protein [Deltaproteobacteria bacterium]